MPLEARAANSHACLQGRSYYMLAYFELCLALQAAAIADRGHEFDDRTLQSERSHHDPGPCSQGLATAVLCGRL
eukprot:5689383-Pleurochrysis_carterae.AAC.2